MKPSKLIEGLPLETPEGLKEARRIITEDTREKTITDLITFIDEPLASDPIERSDQLKDRDELFNTIEKYNDFIERSQRPLPVLENAPSREEAADYKPEFLIDNWLPANRLTLLTGPGGTGKSYLALQHICGLAMGISDMQLTQFHGTSEELHEKNAKAFRKDRPPLNIVVASYEEDLIETWARINRICDWLGWADYDTLKERIKFVDLKMFGPLWGVNEDTHLATRTKLLEVGDWLLNQSQEFGARLLMLDPSAGAYGGSDISRESVREFCSHLNGWGQQVECATLLIAHPPKSGDDYAGSTDWLGSCRAMWTLRIEKENRGNKNNPKWVHWYQLTNAKQNYATPQPPIYLQKIKMDRGGFTPIWTKCHHDDAINFFNTYHNQTSIPHTQKDTNDDDENPYATAFLQSNN